MAEEMKQIEFNEWDQVKKGLTLEDGLKNEAAIFFKIVKEAVMKVAKEAVGEDTKDEIKKDVEERLVKMFGGVPKRIEIVENGQVVREITGTVHNMFEEVVEFVKLDEPVYMVGPAGSGKNVLASQIAEALNLPYYYTNAVTQEYQITGYGDMNGMLVKTPFYEAFTKGGLFLLDELDSSIPEVLNILNMAIANRCFNFPCVGNMKAHQNFRVIAAGNTAGEGANSLYSSRVKLDAASLDRFALVEIDYSPEVEEFYANGNKDVLDYLRGLRKAANVCGVQMTVSYRAFKRLTKMEERIGTERAVKTCVLKALGKDDINILVGEMQKRGLTGNPYVKVTEEIAKKMEG